MPLDQWIDLPHSVDSRGTLTAIESELDIPFAMRRMFFLHKVSGERGGHAHRSTQQLLVAVAGAFTVDISDGASSATHTLDNPNRALYLPPMTWARLYEFSENAVCLVITDTHFADSEYVRDWNEFVAMRNTNPAA